MNNCAIPQCGPFGNTTKGPRTVIVPADPIVWDQSRSYEYLTLVANEGFGYGYVSKKDVPAGTPLTDTDYWIQVASFNAQLADIQKVIKQVIDEILTKPLNVVYQGADKTGATDSSEAFIKAVAYAESLEFGAVYVPEGVYRINSTVEFNQKVKFVFERNVKILAYAGTVFWLNPDNISYQTYQWLYQDAPIISGGVHIVNSGDCDIAIKIGADSALTGNQNVTGWREFGDITITGFKTGIKVTSFNNYLLTFNNLQFSLNNVCVDLFSESGGVNFGEAIKFYNCVFGDCSDTAVKIENPADVFFYGCSFDYIKNEAVSVVTDVNAFYFGGHVEGLGKSLPDDDLNENAVFTSTAPASYSTLIGMAVFPSTKNFIGGNGNATMSKCFIGKLASDRPLFAGNVKFDNVFEIALYSTLSPMYSTSLVRGDFSNLKVGTKLTEGQDIFGTFKNQYIGTANLTVQNDPDMGKAIETVVTGTGSYITFQATFEVRPGKQYLPNFNIRMNASGSIKRGANISFYQDDDLINSVTGDTGSNNAVNANELTPLIAKDIFTAPAGANKATVTFIINPLSALTFTVGQFGVFEL